MTNREFLQHGSYYDARKHGIAGWYLSEKLDGMRAYWDGGVTRGHFTDKVPFANTTKDFRRIHSPQSTGLWTRYAKPIAAPDWFLDMLPLVPLDGELYLGYGRFQELMSIVKRYKPDDRWKEIRYIVFDSPHDVLMFAHQEYARERVPPLPYWKVYNWLMDIVPECRNIDLIEQHKLSFNTAEAKRQVEGHLLRIEKVRGEGVMLRKPESYWTPKRVNTLLKVKNLYTSRGVIVGSNPGKGKLKGMMGSLIIDWNGVIFNLSGFTEEERTLNFLINSTIYFKYRGLTDSGLPKEARYWRKGN
jgi:DNA ligase 1